MIQVVVENDNFLCQANWHPQAQDLLPEHSLVVQNTPFYYGQRSWDDFFSACQKLQAAYPTVPYVFIDASWDPVTLTNDEIIKNLEEIKKADYLIKNIFIIKGKPTSSDIKVEYNGKELKKLTDDELTELVKFNSA